VAKRGLGRGIDALMGNDSVAGGSDNEIRIASVEEVFPNPDQPRKHFSEESLQELADSVREKGVIQPLLVERVSDGSYQIIAGERRYRASKLAGLKTVPVIVREFSQEEKMEIALIENIQREDLSPVEEARAYRGLMESSGYSQEALAERLGKKRSTIANAVRLLRLPEDILDALDQGVVSAGHARALLQSGSDDKIRALFQAIQQDGLSVRQAEVLARGGEISAMSGGLEQKLSAGTKAAAAGEGEKAGIKKSPELIDIERRLVEKLGTKVVLHGSENSGRLEISYFSLDDLNRLIDLLLP
jgi:ParB family chromosome partitioning protein